MLASAKSILLFLALSLLLAACEDASPTLPAVPTAQPVINIPPTFGDQKTLSVTTPTPKISPTLAPSQDENDIKEALLRYQFARVGSNFPTSYYFCLGLETAPQSPGDLLDPPQILLDRFKGNNPPVIRASDCVYDKKLQIVIEKSSGKQAIFWGLGSVTPTGPAKADLELSYLSQFNGTGGSVFQLEWQNTGWTVTGSSITWIS